MPYDKKPKMILFDVGGTLFDDGKCDPVKGFEKLRLASLNPEVTTAEKLGEYWDSFMNDVSGLTSREGIILDIPLSAVIRYATMNTGLHFDIPMAEQEEIFDRFNSSRRVIDGVPELLEALSSQNIRTAVISNNMMSGESLNLAIKRFIPSADFEFCLTSADILFTKPSANIFSAALSYAGLEASDCWYCGDSIKPDVYGSSLSGMTPVLLCEKLSISSEFRSDDKCEKYLAVNNWNVLKEIISELSDK